MSRKRGSLRQPLLLPLGSLLLAFSLTQWALAQDTQRLQQLQKELEQQRQTNTQQVNQLESLRAEIGQLTEQQKQTLGRLDALAEQIAERENSLATLGARASIAERQLNDVVAYHNVTQAKVANLKLNVRKLLDATYRERGSQYLRLLTQASSFSDLLIRLDYTNMSGKQTLEVIDLLKSETLLLEQQRAEREQRTLTLQDLKKRQLTELEALKKQRQQQQAYLSELRQSEAGKRVLALRTREQQGKTADQINALVSQVVQERDKVQAERQRQAEAEAARRAAEAKKLAQEQARARAEQERLAQQQALQEKLAQERAAAQQAEQARLQAEAEARARSIQAEAEAQQEAQARAEEARRVREQAEAQAIRQQQQAQARAAAEQRQQQAALEAQQQALQAQQARLAEQQAAAEAAKKPLNPTGQTLLLPLAGGTIVEPFGTGGSEWVVLASTPTSATPANTQGSAEQGTANQGEAVAALEGDVVAATFYATLGWVVLLDNGKDASGQDVVTGYFGLQEIKVKIGERVRRGQAIGSIGGSYIFGADRMAFQLRRADQPVAPQF